MLNILFNVISKLAQSGVAQKTVQIATSEIAKTVAKVAGGVAAGGIVIRTIDEKNKKEAVRNSFKEGYKAGEETTKQKFAEFIKTQRGRDEFLLLVTKIGVYIAKCDGEFSTEEMNLLDNFIGRVNTSPVTPIVIKERIMQIKQSQLSYDCIVSEMESFLEGYDKESRKDIIAYVDQLIYDIINADGYVHPLKQNFIINWKRIFI